MHNMFNLTRNQRNHTCRKRTCLLPVVAHVMLNFENSSCCGKNGVSGSSDSHQTLRDDLSNGSHGTAGPAGHRKKAGNQKADCFALRKRITRLKLSILESGQPTFNLQRVASSGPMAPCRSHHRYYTRQNWIVEIHQELSPVTCNQLRQLDLK